MDERRELQKVYESDGVDTLIQMILDLRSDNRYKTGKLKAATDEVKYLATKIDEQLKDMQLAKDTNRKYKQLQNANEELGKILERKDEKILELEDINTQMENALPLLKSDLEAEKKKLKEEKRDNKVNKDALASVRADMKAKLEECGKEKTDIHDSLYSTIEKLRKDLSDAKEKDSNVQVVVDRLQGNVSRLQLEMRALRQVEANQKEQLQAMHTKHERDQESLKLTKEALTNELNSAKATNQLLKEQLEKDQESLKKCLNLANKRPASPVARAKEEDKKPGDDKKPKSPKCTFVRIGSKKDQFGNEIGDYKKECGGSGGRKSPLNPNKLARKIKLLF